MSLLSKVFGDSGNAEDNGNEEILAWVVDILKIIEKAGPALNLSSCTVQVIYGNNVQIQVQDWYDDFFPRFAPEHGLDKFFELVPAGGTSDIYVSKTSPHISGSSNQFVNHLEQKLIENQIFGYQRDNRLDLVQKTFYK